MGLFCVFKDEVKKMATCCGRVLQARVFLASTSALPGSVALTDRGGDSLQKKVAGLQS